MSRIMILTDSCCDLTKETIEELGITVLPFEITFNGETFREIFDKSTQEFYDMMFQSDEIPKHSQLSPLTFEQTYKKLFDEGYTDIISISINSEGSGTFNNSIIAKNNFYEDNPEAVDKIRPLIFSTIVVLLSANSIMGLSPRSSPANAAVAEIRPDFLAYLRLYGTA